MTYVTPTTVSTGCLISSASWNQNVVNNVIQIATSPLGIDFTNDYIGVNRVSPAVSLDVQAKTGDATTMRLWGGSSTNNHTRLIFAGASSAGNLFDFRTDTAQTGQKTFSLQDDTNNATRLHVSASGALSINTSTSNTGNTQGLTINQLAAGDEAFSLKVTGLAHGITLSTETDTYGFLKAANSTFGGISLQGYSSSGALNAMNLVAVNGKAADTTKSTAAFGIMNINCLVKSGTGTTLAASTGDLLTVGTGASTRFIFQGGGDLFADSGLTASAYDSHDDVQMVRALEVARAPGTVIRDQFDSWLKYNRKDLEAANLAAFNDPAEGGDGSVFVNVMGLQRLHSGAIWQMHKHTRLLEERIAQLEQLLLGPPRAGAT